MELAAKQDSEPEEQELIMQLSPLYLEKLEAVRQESEQRGRQDFALQLLNRRVGKISVEIEGQIRSLSMEQLESLGDALSNFRNMNDLLAWLQ